MGKLSNDIPISLILEIWGFYLCSLILGELCIGTIMNYGVNEESRMK